MLEGCRPVDVLKPVIKTLHFSLNKMNSGGGISRSIQNHKKPFIHGGGGGLLRLMTIRKTPLLVGS